MLQARAKISSQVSQRPLPNCGQCLLRPPCALLRTEPSIVRRSLQLLRVVKDEGRADMPPQDIESLAKDALKQLNEEEMTVASVLGASNFERLGQTIGQAKLHQITSVLDPILKNRRAITVISAVLDVALIIAGIKLFQAGTSPHE